MSKARELTDQESLLQGMDAKTELRMSTTGERNIRALNLILNPFTKYMLTVDETLPVDGFPSGRLVENVECGSAEEMMGIAQRCEESGPNFMNTEFTFDVFNVNDVYGDHACNDILPIEIYPAASGGIRPSATEEEKTQVVLKSSEVRRVLSDAGFGEGLELDSGNRRVLIYPTSLGHDPERLVQKFNVAVKSMFSDSNTCVEVAWNGIHLPGTMVLNGNGSHEPQRRRTYVVNIPKRFEVIPNDELRRIVSCAREERR